MKSSVAGLAVSIGLMAACVFVWAFDPLSDVLGVSSGGPAAVGIALIGWGLFGTHVRSRALVAVCAIYLGFTLLATYYSWIPWRKVDTAPIFVLIILFGFSLLVTADAWRRQSGRK
jgi:hypothetical protein